MKIRYLYKQYWRQGLLIILLSLSYGFLASYPLKLLKKFIDDAVQFELFENINRLYFLVCIYALFQIIASFVLNIQRFVITKAQSKIAHDLRMKIYYHLSCVYQSFYDEHDTTETLNSLMQDSDMLSQGFISPISNISRSIFSFCFGFAYMWQISPTLTLIIFPLAIVIGILTKFSSSRFKKLSSENRKKNSYMWKVTRENLQGMREIHAFNQEEKSYIEVNNASRQMAKNFSNTAFFAFLMNMVNALCLIVMISSMLLVGINLLSKKMVTVGSIMAIFSYNTLLSTPVQNIVTMFYDLAKVNVSKNRIKLLLDEKTDFAYENDFIEIDNNYKIAVKFESVTFFYNTDRTILDNISFEILKGEKVAFVGLTGSGKTTILKLIEGLYEIQDGNVIEFDKKVNTKFKKSIRKHIGYVFQDTFLFNDTIKNNIVFSNPSAEKKYLDTIIECSCVNDIISKLPNGIDTKIGENGIQLSGGERQRIGIARALLKKPELLILDEATSALDNETEKKLMLNIVKTFPSITIIMVAHRLSTIESVDRIYYIESGKLVESGTYDELLQKNSKFKQLNDQVMKGNNDV